MSEPSLEATCHLSPGVSITIVKVMCGSPTGMEQLIKYFESQSGRLNRQTPQCSLSSMNTEFMSAIKFNGVPILPPAMTSSRQDELRQLKKDAVLLEKRLKARHRQELLAKADSLINQSQVYFPENSPRKGVRQLNFDSVGQDEHAKVSPIQSGIVLCSTVSRADNGTDLEDYGLQTMDSVGSEFMSLDSDSIPRVFSGLALTSVKEQKISYDLDRLSKALNVQDLVSTSNSDVSEILECNNEQDVKKPESATIHAPNSTYNLHEKIVPLASSQNKHDGKSASAFQQNYTTLSKGSPELGKAFKSSTGSAGVGEYANAENLDQSKASATNSPGYGSAKTSTVIEGQWSNRSSPKSVKSGVHFSSFVTEYINTSCTQAKETSTVIKRKISSCEHDSTYEHNDHEFVPIIGGPNDYRKKTQLVRKGSDCENYSGLIEIVPFVPDVDQSFPSFIKSSQKPFQEYVRSETYSSDKENDASQLHINFSEGYIRPLEPDSKCKNLSGKGGNTETTTPEKMEHKNAIEKMNNNFVGRNKVEEKATMNVSPIHSSSLQSDSSSVIKRMEGFHDISSPSVSSSNTTSLAESSCSLLKTVCLREDSVRNISVSDSEFTNKTNTLSKSSESSVSTVEQDFSTVSSVRDGNVYFARLPTDSMKSGKNPERSNVGNINMDKEKSPKLVTKNSPKKLNTGEAMKGFENQDRCVTPKQTNICRNSYTLSEPSPALVQAQGRPKAEKNELNHEQKTTTTDDKINEKQHKGIDQLASSKGEIPAPIKNTIISETSMTLGAEPEGKAEHINKYLSQVLFQNSMNFTDQSWDIQQVTGEEGAENMEGPYEVEPPLPGRIIDDEFHSTSVLDILKSVAQSHGSLEQLTIEELLELHQQQMNEKRQTLIRQQQKDMEELFVQQRREVMLLETEIKAAQQLEKDQQKFLVQNAPENIKVKSKSQENEYSPLQTGNFENNDAKLVNQISGVETSLNTLQPQSSQLLPSPNPLSVSNFKIQTKTYAWVDAKPGNSEQRKSKPQVHQKKLSINHKPPEDTNQDNKKVMKTISKNNLHSRSVFSIDDIGLATRSPEFSTSGLSPHLHHHPAVMRSPLKYASFSNHQERVVVPPEAYLPEMKAKFDKVTAVGKGFLTRLLLKSDKVQELKKTIRDTREFAFSFQTETPIKKGTFTSQDKVLLERLVAQLQAAVLDIHEIFFDIPVSERMALIEQTRLSEQEKRAKAALRDSTRESTPKISQATMKALERKRKSREAETSTVSASRSRTASSRTISPPRSNLTESRVLKPLPGQTQISPGKLDMNREENGRPESGKEKPLARNKRIIALPNKSASVLVRTNSDIQKKGSLKLSVVTLKPAGKSKQETNKQLSRPSKSWR